MSDKTGISYLDATWNPTTGCEPVSTGCANCWAKRMAGRMWGKQFPWILSTEVPGTGHPRQFSDVMCHEDRLSQPLHWRKPRRIGVSFMGDLFHEAVPDEFIAKVFGVMGCATQHTFYVLTKRLERMRRVVSALDNGRGCNVVLPAWDGKGAVIADRATRWPLRNVLLGATAEDQERDDERVVALSALARLGWRTWWSLEPLLSPIDMRLGGNSLPDYAPHRPVPPPKLVLIGGESGPHARPADVAWIRSIVEQCKAAGVPAYMKQDSGGGQGRIPDDLWAVKELPA